MDIDSHPYIAKGILEELSEINQVQTRETEFAAFIKENFPHIHIVRTIEGFEDRETIYAGTVKLLKEEPDLRGIFIACGGVDAAGRAIKEAGKALETSVVSFEDYPEILDLIREQVIDCTINNELIKQGRKSLPLMMDYLIYGNQPAVSSVYVGSKILVKESL